MSEIVLEITQPHSRVIELYPPQSQVLELYTPGPQGPRGQPSEDGAARFHYVQSSPLDTWTVNHNFGYLPVSVSVRSPGGVEVDAQITHVSLNQVIINFAAPYTGTVELM